MRSSWLLCALLAALFGAGQAGAATGPQAAAVASPIGRWKTIDDVTGKAKSIVMIWEENGKLFGRVQNLLNPDPNIPNPTCRACSGDQKDKPVVGMRILWGLQKDKDGWSGGTILDPESGKVYRCLLSLAEGGTKLKVRGFIGFSLLGRTQYWDRE